MLLPSKRCLRLCLDHCTRNPVLLFHYSLSFRPIFISFPPCMNPYSLHKFVSKCYFVSNTISQRVPNMLSDHQFYNSRRIYSLTSPHVQLRLSSVKSSLFQVYNCEIFGGSVMLVCIVNVSNVGWNEFWMPCRNLCPT